MVYDCWRYVVKHKVLVFTVLNIVKAMSNRNFQVCSSGESVNELVPMIGPRPYNSNSQVSERVGRAHDSVIRLHQPHHQVFSVLAAKT